MYARQITSEETYTLAEARRIINKEREQKREIFLSKAKQKLLGLTAIGISIAEIILGYFNLIDGGGVSIIMLPVGIYLLFTREIIA